MKVLEESGACRDPLTSSTAVDWHVSADLFELSFPVGLKKLNNSFDSKSSCYCKQDLIRPLQIRSLCSIKKIKGGGKVES